jgi:hypothetical protein
LDVNDNGHVCGNVRMQGEYAGYGYDPWHDYFQKCRHLGSQRHTYDWTLANGVRAPINAPFNAQNPSVLTRIFAGAYAGVGGDSTYEYTIEGLAPGTYSCLAVGFRTNRSYNSTKKTATLGVYWNNPNNVSSGLYIPSALNDPAPSTITVAKGDNVQLDFKADVGFVNTWFYGIVPYIP